MPFEKGNKHGKGRPKGSKSKPTVVGWLNDNFTPEAAHKLMCEFIKSASEGDPKVRIQSITLIAKLLGEIDNIKLVQNTALQVNTINEQVIEKARSYLSSSFIESSVLPEELKVDKQPMQIAEPVSEMVPVVNSEPIPLPVVAEVLSKRIEEEIKVIQSEIQPKEPEQSPARQLMRVINTPRTSRFC